jgi:hypothetical protein
MTHTHYEGDQVAIQEDPMPPIETRACAWCGEPAVEERTVVPERKNAEKVVVKPAKLAPVCKAHSEMIDRNVEVASLWRRRKIHAKNLTHPDELKAAAAKQQMREIEGRLLELGERLDRPYSEPA